MRKDESVSARHAGLPRRATWHRSSLDHHLHMRPHRLVAGAAVFVAGHQRLAGVLEAGGERRHEARHQHRVGVGGADDEAVYRIGARRAERHRRVDEPPGDEARTVLLPRSAHGDLAVGAHRGAEVAVDEFARGRRPDMPPSSTRRASPPMANMVTTIITTSNSRIAPTTMAQRRSAASPTSCAACAPFGTALMRPPPCVALRCEPAGRISLHRPSRQIDEEIEQEPDRDDDGRREAGDRERARRPARHEGVDGVLASSSVAMRSSGMGIERRAVARVSSFGRNGRRCARTARRRPRRVARRSGRRDALQQVGFESHWRLRRRASAPMCPTM